MNALMVIATHTWQNASDRFGSLDGCDGDRLPAPALPMPTQ
ncbi:hypothetical protein M2271_007582 [Streptomyces sp. LBL]|nr:hypothetical protein [Streptomyces sp. LBL]MDH6629744.1 hypothetical protein [Streptomyces sp. LBL]